jgi:ketosteroid isomerase-like protein
MSRENVEALRRSVEHFVSTGEPQWSALHDWVEVYDHDILDAGQYRGREGFARWIEDWSSAWSSFSMEPIEYVDAGEHVIAFLRMIATGRGSGVAVEREDAMVCRVHDGKVIRVDYYNNRAQALKAVGLEG